MLTRSKIHSVILLLLTLYHLNGLLAIRPLVNYPFIIVGIASAANIYRNENKTWILKFIHTHLRLNAATRPVHLIAADRNLNCSGRPHTVICIRFNQRRAAKTICAAAALIAAGRNNYRSG